MTDEELDIEDRIFVEQVELIEKRFGKRAAEMANYGWAVDTVDQQYVTKIYGHGTLTTDMDTGEHHFHENV